jgi:heptosyltransferase-1
MKDELSMRILIIKTSSLGDVIHALPVLDYLRQVAPEARIDWVVEEPFLPLVAHHPVLEQVHVIRTKAWRKAPLAQQTRQEVALLRRVLRAAQYDLVFDLQGNLKSGLVAWMTGARQRVGFTADVLQERLNWLFTTIRIPFRDVDNRAASRYLRLVSALFQRDYREMSVSGTIVSSPEDEAIAATYLAELPEGPKILLQVGTTWETKLWYPEGWIELARRILAYLPETTLLINWGSTAEKELGERIVAEVGSSVQLLPWFKIRELIPVIRRMDLVIGGDTGPVYLAEAVGTATVSLYRASKAALYAPTGPHHRFVQAEMPCTGCMLTRCERNATCSRSITIDAVTEAAIAVLQEKGTQTC